jgi:hypothetical protein
MPQSSAHPALDGLLDLACREGVDIRPTLLRVLTDLYVQKPGHTTDEEAQYVELAGRLIDAVDAATREAVAARLSGYRAAPEAILRRLARAETLAGEAAPPPPEKPAQPDLAELFFGSNAEERRLILINLDLVAEAARQPQSEAADAIRQLESAALQRNTIEFTYTLEGALGVAHRLAERIVRDYSGEPVVVAAKALAMPAAVLQRILLFLNPAIGQSVERVYDLARLFDEITPAASQRMVTIWRHAGARPKPAHAPVHYDDERRSARAASAPAEHRVARERAPLPARFRSNGG